MTKRAIDPMIDCVFKALLGASENTNLTINFLNAILKPKIPIDNIEILNPYNERSFLGDKLTIVDIKVKDDLGQNYQIEVQLAIFSYLPERMLYTWSDIYQAQLGSGDDFHQLKPVISIWLLRKTLFNESPNHHHHFQAYDPVNKVQLSDHLSIHILELDKWQKTSASLNKEDEWLYFFQTAKNWDQLPTELDNSEMRQAMQVLSLFSEKEKAYHLYQSRQNALRDEATKKYLFEQAERDKEHAEHEKEQAQRDNAQAQREKEQAQREKEQAQRDNAQAQRENTQAQRENTQAQRDKEQAQRDKEQAEHNKEKAEHAAKEAEHNREKAESETLETRQKIQAEILKTKQEKQQNERLMKLLKAAGIDPDQP